MSVIKNECVFTSCVGDAKIHVVSWKPEGTPKAVFQFSHGMAEYIDRYDSMARYLAERGYAVYGNDHLGHGQSVNGTYPLGFFGKTNECGRVFVEDLKRVTDLIKAENPGVKIVLFGHSMGSFLARLYLAKYSNEVDAAIICGTAGPNPIIGAALGLTKVLSAAAPTAPGTLMNNLAFGSYNKTTDKRTAFDWLSFNTENVDTYIDDPLCGFLFSNQGFRDLITMNNVMCKKEAFEGCRNDLPMFFVAGKDDPVGSYGKGVEQAVESYKASGNTNVECKLYNSRHEIHNEKNPEGFYDDLIAFAEKALA